MSRVPRTSPSSSNLRGQTRSTSTPTKSTPLNAISKLKVPNSVTKPKSSSPSKQTIDKLTEPPIERLSLKEQIALKRAEARKVAQSQKNQDTSSLLNDGPDSIPILTVKSEDVDDLGRWGIRETVERARNTGNINLSSRSLPCIPSCLFEIHLNITPKPLDSVEEPDYPVEDNSRRLNTKQQTSWFEAQDLVVLKARSNEIVAIQPELSLFGSLKVIDLHSNRLSTLPTSLTILSSLTTLDVSNNSLSEFPPSLFSLPALTTLNLANNSLKTLRFAQFNCPIDLPNSVDTGAFFQPEVGRAIEPLPNLYVLDVAHNKITTDGIDYSHLPRSIQRLLLSYNPLGKSNELFAALGKLKNLQEIVADHALINDDSFDHDISVEFPKLQILDLSETDVTERAIRSYFTSSTRVNELNFEVSTANPGPSELRVSVGKKVIREAWEIEAEKNYLKKKRSTIGTHSEKKPQAIEKESWELEVEQGITTKAGLRRAQLAAAASSSNVVTKPASISKPVVVAPAPRVVEKEQWEIEAEQGLLTEGGRRRLRAQQAAAKKSKVQDTTQNATNEQNAGKPNPSLSNSSYYNASDNSLKLPSSAPPSRSHVRAFSMAATLQRKNGTAEELLVPAPTLPLAVISRQDFAGTLQVLNLSNRRADTTFAFPTESLIISSSASGGVLPRLTELILEGCGLNDLVSVSYEPEDGITLPAKQKSLTELIAESFPSLTVLDLSYNALTSEGLSTSALEKLLVPSESGKGGLRILRLRGNRINALDALEPIANLFRGNRRVAEWRLEELDVRDNEIGRLSPLLGLMPVDVFLVDGNLFRVPPRKIWEREGTKGLLSWLRGRIE